MRLKPAMPDGMMKSRIRLGWAFVAAFAILLGPFASTLTVFAHGSRSDGAPVAGHRSLLLAIRRENAGETARLFDVGNGRALLVEASMVSAVRHGPSRYPCAFACGRNELQGESVNFPIACGAKLVAQYPNEDGTHATLDTSIGAYFPSTPPKDPDVAASVGGVPLSPEEVIGRGYPELPLQKVSCVVITLAELLLLAIGAGFAFIRERKKGVE